MACGICKDYAVNNHMSDFSKMFLARRVSGYCYINSFRLDASYYF
jgi:hypothetical protein